MDVSEATGTEELAGERGYPEERSAWLRRRIGRREPGETVTKEKLGGVENGETSMGKARPSPWPSTFTVHTGANFFYALVSLRVR